MAFTASYELPARLSGSSGLMLRATSGGTVFTQIAYNAVAFDYFSDTAVVDDAFYYNSGGRYGIPPAGLKFNVGTPFNATSVTVVWEYYRRGVGWTAIPDIVDSTVGFTVAGVNYVKFPQLWQPQLQTIDGAISTWVRCRITAVSGITEGGANQTDTVKFGFGVLTISGTTDAVPGTFTEIYDWLKANEPHISVKKGQGNSFDFTMVGIHINSRVYTTNEIIELGPDCRENVGAGLNDINYLTSGIKLNDTTGYGGSTIIVYGTHNSSVCNTGSETKLYGTTVRSGKSADSFIYAGYFKLAYGEYIDCNIEQMVQPPYYAGAIARNVRIICSFFYAGKVDGVFDSIKFLTTGYGLFYVYQTGWTLTDFGYQFKRTAGYLFTVYQGSGPQSDYDWKLINPSTPVNTFADNIKPIRVQQHKTKAIEKLWFYDVSAGTYTDYTTEAASATADDVPLHGDVGDMFYFGMTDDAHRMFSLSIYIEKTTANNDYTYKWEYYKSGAWHEVNHYWDACDNLGKTGSFYTNNDNSDNIAINGHSTDWLRATIMTKGAETPVATKVLQRECSGVNKWHLKEVYSCDIKVIDVNANNISGATVIGTDENDVEVFSVNTDADGEIATQEQLKKWWYFDPANNPSTLISENLYTDFTIEIKKAGYKTYKTKFEIDKKVNWTICLNKQVSLLFDKGNLFLNLNKSNPTDNSIHKI